MHKHRRLVQIVLRAYLCSCGTCRDEAHQETALRNNYCTIIIAKQNPATELENRLHQLMDCFGGLTNFSGNFGTW